MDETTRLLVDAIGALVSAVVGYFFGKNRRR
jgi:hypothetical protein